MQIVIFLYSPEGLTKAGDISCIMARVLFNTFAFLFFEHWFKGKFAQGIMKKILLIIFLSGMLFSCRQKKPVMNMIALKMELLDADRSFSKMSEMQGMRTAYMSYIDSNGVLLRPNNLPVTGGDAVDLISQSNDSTYIMTWEPKSASIAASGELGYTYGIYSYKIKNTDTVLFGTYVTIWKKQPDDKWKFVLQTANEGVE